MVGGSVLGNPAALDVIGEFADANDLIFFEDNCESMDAELNGRKTGAFGHLGTFSTFFSHHVSTIEGGVIALGFVGKHELPGPSGRRVTR